VSRPGTPAGATGGGGRDGESLTNPMEVKMSGTDVKTEGSTGVPEPGTIEMKLEAMLCDHLAARRPEDLPG
jgi:hypothetical protein